MAVTGIYYCHGVQLHINDKGSILAEDLWTPNMTLCSIYHRARHGGSRLSARRRAALFIVNRHGIIIMTDIGQFAVLLAHLLMMNPSMPLGKTGSELAQLQCLTSSVYYEMRNRNEAVQIGVAYAVKNRVHSGRYPTTYCGVLKQPSQFPWVHNPHQQKPDTNWKPLWAYAAGVALSVHYALVDDPTRGATHFCMADELHSKSAAMRRAVSWCKHDGLWLQDVKFVNPDRSPDALPYAVIPPSRHPSARKTVQQILAALS